jgi:hypothetical protein
MIARLKFRLIIFPALFTYWHLISPKIVTTSGIITNSFFSSIGYILLIIVIDYTINRNTAEKLHVPVEKIYQARYEIGWDTKQILFYGDCFEDNLETEIHNRSVAKLKQEAKPL